MAVRLTNKSGGLIVCDLADGTTLRLNNKASDTIEDSAVTKHIKNLVTKGLLLSKEVKSETAEKRKEEKKNGNV